MPKVAYLAKLKKQLEKLGMPIYWTLPKPEVEEPFVVIGVSTGNTAPTAKTNRLIRDDTQQVDIFLSKNIGRVEAERIQSRALNVIGRSQVTTNEMLIDDSIGREVFHIVIRISNLIF